MKNAHLAHIIIVLDSAGLLNYIDEYFNSTEGSGSTEQEAMTVGDVCRDGTLELVLDKGAGFWLMDNWGMAFQVGGTAQTKVWGAEDEHCIRELGLGFWTRLLSQVGFPGKQTLSWRLACLLKCLFIKEYPWLQPVFGCGLPGEGMKPWVKWVSATEEIPDGTNI